MRARRTHDAEKVAALVAAAFFAVLTPAKGRAQDAPMVTPRVVVDSVEVVGNTRNSVNIIRAYFGVQPDASVSFRDIQRGTKELMASGQFADVSVRAVDSEAGNDRAVLVVDVEEHPHVRNVSFVGLRNASERETRDTTGLEPNQPYSPSEVAEAQAFIRSELARKGIPFARIEERLEPVPDTVNVVDVVLEVTEGTRVTVADFRVHGSERVAAEAIVDAMAIQPEGFLWFKSGTYDPTLYDEDLENAIPAVYYARGFLDFQILEDTLVVDPQTGKARIELTVDEGPQYRIADFSVEGNREFPDSVLELYFSPERGGLLAGLGIGGGAEAVAGRVFDQVAFESAAEEVRELYANQGFLYAQLIPGILKNPAREGEQPTVDVSWVIREGLPAYIRRVAVTGNDYTYDWVVRDRVFLLPGDRYSQALVLQSYQSIASLGFFETPMPPPDIQPDPETGDVDIIFNVRERQTGSVNFGTSVGGGVGLSGFVGYEQPNLFGQAKSGRLRWDFGRYLNNFELSFTDPALLKSQVSGSVSLFNARDRFFQFATGRRRRVGASANFGFPVPNATRTRVFTGYSIARTDYELFSDVDDTSLFGLPPGTQSTFLFGITRNTVNHPIFPTLGSRQSWNIEVNGGLLGGDGDFIKHRLEGTWWVPVGQLGGGAAGAGGPQFAFGLSLRAGAIFGDASRFPFDRFFMGGVQFGEELRGYDETAITPFGFYAEGAAGIQEGERIGDAFLSLTAEYALRMSDNASISAFLDAGNVWADPRDVDPSRLYRGGGVGVQLMTPFGPIGIDYAYGFDKPEPGWQFHFNMGGRGL